MRARCLSHVYHTYNMLQYSATVPKVLEHVRHQFALQWRDTNLTFSVQLKAHRLLRSHCSKTIRRTKR